MSPVFWTLRLHFGPAPRMAHAMSFDAERRRVVLHGGMGVSGRLGDTWVWDGSYWTQVAETGPSARSGHAMVYDPRRRHVLLFGGTDGNAALGDSWVWDGRTWTQVAETGPQGRSGHAMAFDDENGVVVLFGGRGGAELGDTWRWDGATWTQLEVNGPSARYGHGMAHDTGSARVVLFGGAFQSIAFDDTWEWNGSQWRQVAQFGPPVVVNGTLTSDGRGALLFGGAGSADLGVEGFSSTWARDGTFWTEIQHFGPPGRTAHAAAFDTLRRRVVIHGGVRTSAEPGPAAFLGDTWECPARAPLLVAVTLSPTSVALGGTLVITARLSGPATSDVTVRVAARSDQTASLSMPSVPIADGHTEASATMVVPAGTPPGQYTVEAALEEVTRSVSLMVSSTAVPARLLDIVALLPDPIESDLDNEQVHLRNNGLETVLLAGWRITNLQGVSWQLDGTDGLVPPLASAVVVRKGRPMALANTGGTVLLIDPDGNTVDTKTYGQAMPGQVMPVA